MAKLPMRTSLVAWAVLALGAILLGPGKSDAQNGLRRAYMPVTFTQEGWCRQGQDIVFSRWQYAFRNFNFYGTTRRNWLYAGHRRTMSVEGSRAGLTSLMRFFPQMGEPRALTVNQDYIIPIALPDAGLLAGEVVALTMNVAFNDTRMMPRHPGYDIELFKLRASPFRGKTVGEVLDIANRILGGDHPMRYGLPDHRTTAAIVRAINCNYEFINYDTYIDRGFLIPNRPFGPATRPHDPHVP